MSFVYSKTWSKENTSKLIFCKKCLKRNIIFVQKLKFRKTQKLWASDINKVCFNLHYKTYHCQLSLIQGEFVLNYSHFTDKAEIYDSNKFDNTIFARTKQIN